MTSSAEVATVLSSLPASSDTMESEADQLDEMVKKRARPTVP